MCQKLWARIRPFTFWKQLWSDICTSLSVLQIVLVGWFLVASQVSDVITSVSLDQTENPGVYFTNLVAQLQLAILNYNEVQINIVTGPLLDIDYFQIVPHWKWQIWVVCIIPIFNQLDQILLQSRNQLKLVGSHMEQANEMVMEW